MIAFLAPQDLASIDAEWRSLAEHAIEPNPFFESFFLREALDALRGGDEVSILTVRISGVLALLMPVVSQPRFRGLPLGVLTTWRNLYDALGTPLVHRDHAVAALEALLGGLGSRPERVLELSDVGADGPFHAALTDVLRSRKAMSFVVESHTRAVFKPGTDVEVYLEGVLDGRKRKEFRRLERRLGETTGALEYRSLRTEAEARTFAKEFLAIEGSGWKAQRGTALASTPAHSRFFENVVQGAAALGQLDGFSLYAGDKIIAALCSIRCPDRGATPPLGDTYFAWKIAYDDAFAKSSPGILLELENIRRLHGCGHLVMDSCAAPDHAVSNCLWRDRRTLETVILPADNAGALLVSAMPILQWGKRRAREIVHRARKAVGRG